MNQRQQIEQYIAEKAMKDENFRASLIQDTKLTIEKEFGVTLPDSFQINILEEKPNTFYLVLPALPASPTENELTEAELQEVAAGGNAWYDHASSDLCPKLTFAGGGCNPH